MRVLMVLMLGLFGLATAHAGCGNESGVRELGEETAWKLTQTGSVVQIGGGIGCTGVGTAQSFMDVTLLSAPLLTNVNTGHTLNYVVRTSQFTGQLQLNTPREVIPGSTSAASLFSVNNQLPLYISMSKSGGLSGLAPGEYTALLQLRYRYSISLSDGTFAETAGMVRPGGPTNANLVYGGADLVNLTLRVVVESSCHIPEKNDIDFGDQPLVRRFSEQEVLIVVQCSAETPYTLGLSDGNNASGGQRRMLSSEGNYLTYEFYKNDGSNWTRWGDTGAERWDSSSLDPDPTNQRYHNARARILETSTPPVGDYSDTLRVEVEF